jgi:hypothetical protein
LIAALLSDGAVATAPAVIGTAAVTFSFARSFRWSYSGEPRGSQGLPPH